MPKRRLDGERLYVITITMILALTFLVFSAVAFAAGEKSIGGALGGGAFMFSALLAVGLRDDPDDEDCF